MTDYQLEFGIPRGPQGPQGPVGATGPRGPQGPIGPQGPPGDIGTPPVFGAPLTGAPGSAVNVTGTGTADDPIILTVPAGEPGPAGPTGPQGSQGAQGPQGPKGDTGPRGPQGPQGPKGATAATAFSGIAVNLGTIKRSGSSTYAKKQYYLEKDLRNIVLAGAASYGDSGSLSISGSVNVLVSEGSVTHYKLANIVPTNADFIAFLNTVRGNRSTCTVHMTLSGSTGTVFQPYTKSTWTWNGSYLAPKTEVFYGYADSTASAIGEITVS